MREIRPKHVLSITKQLAKKKKFRQLHLGMPVYKRHNAIEMRRTEWEAEVERVLGEWTARGHKEFTLEDVRAVLTQLNRWGSIRSCGSVCNKPPAHTAQQVDDPRAHQV